MILVPSSFDPEEAALGIVSRLRSAGRLPAVTDAGAELCARDIRAHVEAFLAALGDAGPGLFAERAAWAALALRGLGRPADELTAVLEALPEAVAPALDDEASSLASKIVAAACARASTAESDAPRELGRALTAERDRGSLTPRTRDWLAAMTQATAFAREPELAIAHGVDGRGRCLRDLRTLLQHLERALEAGESTSFVEHVRWTAHVLSWSGVARTELSTSLAIMSELCDAHLAEEIGGPCAEVLAEATTVAAEGHLTPRSLGHLAARSELRSGADEPGPAIRQAARDLARLSVALYYMRHPRISLAHGETGRAACASDAETHFLHVADAVEADSPDLLADYFTWVQSVLEAAGVTGEVLFTFIESLTDAVRFALDARVSEPVVEVVEASLERLCAPVTTAASVIDESKPIGRLARRFNDLLLAGKRHDAAQLIQEALGAGTPLTDIYIHVFQASQYEIGRLWQRNEVTVAQEHFCTAATQMIMSQVSPSLFTGERVDRTLVATCVTDDLHEIGIRMVCDFFEMNGWDTFYLGANTPVASTVSSLVERGADILAISATIGTHVHRVREVIRAVRSSPDLGGTKILVGGLPFLVDRQLWKSVGADGHAIDAEEAVREGTRLLDTSP